MATFLETKTLETSQDVLTACQAYDYLRGAIRRHFESFLTQNITDWRKRKVIPIWDETLREIVEKSSHTYNDSPKRQIFNDAGEVDPDKSTLYFDIIGEQEFGFVSMQEEFDQLRRCLQVALVLVTYSNEAEKITFDILSRNNCEVKFNRNTKQIEELMYTSGVVGKNGGKVFHLWTEEHIIDLERDVESDVDREIGREPNPYGRVPVAYAYDAYKPLYCFWPAARWETLLTLNNAVGLSHTETGHAARYQKFPPLFTDSDIPEGVIIGPDSIVKLTKQAPDQPPFIEYKNATNLPQLLKAFDDSQGALVITIAGQWGVNLRAEGTGSADSGFKLIVEELPNTEIRVKRIGTAEAFEARLHSVVTDVAAYHQLGDLSGTFKADFGTPRLPVNNKEDSEITTMKLATGVWELEDAWMHENPEITPDEIKEKRARVDAKRVNSAVGSLPTFEEV